MRRIPFVLSAALLLSTGLQAQPVSPSVDNHFSNDYLQLGYQSQDWGVGLDIDALSASGSLSIDEHFYLRGRLSLYDGRAGRGPGRTNLDGTGISAGLGFNTPLKTDLDLVATADIIHDRYRFSGGGRDNDTGVALAGGVRHRATADIELSGGVFAQRIGRENEVGVYGEGLLKLTPPFDVGLDLRVGDDLTAIGLFGRYNF